MAFPSPPARRSIARHGHPRNTNAPIAAIMPRTKRTMGAEPPRGLNSRVAMAAASEPSTSPMISGRRYWTMAARCRPSPPATSRSKHATQIPMFAGLPSFCSHTAIRPMTAPTTMMPGVVAKRFFLISYSFPNVLADTPCIRWLHPERGKRRNALRPPLGCTLRRAAKSSMLFPRPNGQEEPHTVGSVCLQSVARIQHWYHP